MQPYLGGWVFGYIGFRLITLRKYNTGPQYGCVIKIYEFTRDTVWIAASLGKLFGIIASDRYFNSCYKVRVLESHSCILNMDLEIFCLSRRYCFIRLSFFIWLLLPIKVRFPHQFTKIRGKLENWFMLYSGSQLYKRIQRISSFYNFSRARSSLLREPAS